MDKHLREQLDQLQGDINQQYQLARIDDDSVTDFILHEMANSIIEGDWQTWYTLLGITNQIGNESIKANVLNQLLLMPGHHLHQEVTRAIQLLGHPSSVPYIRKILESNFVFLDYTGSPHESIAKWFSHALADIGTVEALDLISEFSDSDNHEIAAEMAYRLVRLNE